MPYPLALLPDDELALLQYFKSITALTALIPAAQMRTELPNKPTYPFLLVTRAGGVTVDGHGIDEASLQVDVVGAAGTKQATKQAAQLARAAVLAIANDIVAEATLVSGHEEVGPSWLPDTVPTPPLPRYTARYRVLLHK